MSFDQYRVHLYVSLATTRKLQKVKQKEVLRYVSNTVKIGKIDLQTSGVQL